MRDLSEQEIDAIVEKFEKITQQMKQQKQRNKQTFEQVPVYQNIRNYTNDSSSNMSMMKRRIQELSGLKKEENK